MNKLEQLKRIQDSNSLRCTKLCPLTRDRCSTNCICFESAQFTETKHFFEAMCVSPLIDGVITVER